MCTRGDPLMDLGYLLNCWSDPDDDPSWRGASPTPGCAPGLPTRRELVERYARATGFDVERAHQTRDARFAALGERVERLAAKGLALL